MQQYLRWFATFASFTLLASAAQASLISIVENPAPASLTAIQPTDVDLTDGYLKQYHVGSSGYISFSDTYVPDNGLVPVTESLTTPDWFAPTVLDGRSATELPVFTTGPNGSSTLVIDFSSLHLDVFSFTFSLGANRDAGGWFEVHYTGGRTGLDAVARESAISIGPNITAGYVTRDFGVYGDSASCTVINKIVVDPPPDYAPDAFYWGVGNMALGAGACATVPEPGTLTLLGIGLAALLVKRRRQEPRRRC